jgi:hypothetical protein
MLAKERRTRLIRFRVSPDEYESLSRFCASSGARSLSDMARSALQQTMRGQPSGGDLAVLEELRRVSQTLREMNDELANLRHLLTERSQAPRGAQRNSEVQGSTG